MKKIIITLVLTLIPTIISANEISNIDMNIYVDNSGTAHVTEKWIATLYEGTEGYKPYYNLGESSIENYKVSLNGIEYTYADNYNINASFESKAYINGFHYIDNGIELCFGISKYGKNTYTLTYDITNFVVNTSDGYQMIYWTLFPYNYNPSPSRVYIKIHSDFSYPDTLDVWGYGKYGAPTYVYDGYIEMDSEDTVSSSEYMTILVKFPKNTFTSSIVMDKTFSDYLTMANKGAKQYKEPIRIDEILHELIIFFLKYLIFILPIIILYFIGCIDIKTRSYGTLKMKFPFRGKHIKNITYQRELPYNIEQINRVYWFASEYKMMKNTSDYLKAILIKWLKTNNITISKDNIILNSKEGLNKREQELYEILKLASNNNILNKKTFKNLCKYHSNELASWLTLVIDDETSKLIEEGKLVRIKDGYTCYVNDIAKEEAIQIKGVKNFLKDFSNMKDKSPIEVNLYSEYLIYAVIFGMSKKIRNNLKYLSTDERTNNIFTSYEYINKITTNLNIAMGTKLRNYNNAKSSNSNNYSSGGGGFSSSSGGGGSFGGGSGGGGFR